MSLKILLSLLMLLSFSMVSCGLFDEEPSNADDTSETGNDSDVDEKNDKQNTPGDRIYIKNAVSNGVDLKMEWGNRATHKGFVNLNQYFRLSPNECVSILKSVIQKALAYKLIANPGFDVTAVKVVSCRNQKDTPSEEKCKVQNYVITSDESWWIDDYVINAQKLSAEDKANCKTYEEYKAK